MAFPDILIGSKFDAKGFKQAQSATAKLNKGVKNLAASFGVAFGTAAIIGYAKASVKAAAADQKAQQQLALALKNVGLERDAASAERFIQTLQSEYGVIDDLLRPSYQKLAVATKNTAETQRLLGIALDISASTGKDLDSVTGALSKAYLGNNTALGKLGVGISKADLKTKSFKEITDDLSKTFKGSAKAASETFAGSVAKLGVAAANVQEIIGTGLIDALKMLGEDTSVSDLATNMENAATNVANLIRGMGVLLSQLDKLPGGFKLDVAMIPIIGTYLSLLTEAGAKAARIAAVGGQKNPIQAGTYLSTQKKITALTKEQQKAQAKILADKKSQAILDKANLALGKGADVFDMDKIQLNAALIGQAEALGKATTSAQILGIANDIQRLKVKQSISELEDAIASKDDAAIVKATAKLNEDLKILGALQRQDAKLLDINRVLAGMKSTDLINLQNLQDALALLQAMALLNMAKKCEALAEKPKGFLKSGITYIGKTPFVTGPVIDPKLSLDTVDKTAAATSVLPEYISATEFFSSLSDDQKADLGGYSPYMNTGMGYGAGGSVVINVNAGAIGDENTIVDAVQNAMNEIARRGYLTTYAGAISA
jgi:hypothetical protein